MICSELAQQRFSARSYTAESIGDQAFHLIEIFRLTCGFNESHFRYREKRQ